MSHVKFSSLQKFLFLGDCGSVLPNPELPSALNDPPPTSQSMALQANLALWKYTGEKVTSCPQIVYIDLKQKLKSPKL